MNDICTMMERWNKAILDRAGEAAFFLEGVGKYNSEFLYPLTLATMLFQNVEAVRSWLRSPLENGQAYLKLFNFNLDLISRYSLGTLKTVGLYNEQELGRFFEALQPSQSNGNGLGTFFTNQKEAVRWAVQEYPKAIRDIEPEYGFHFEKEPKSLFAETDRFVLRQVMPTEPGVTVDNQLKPLVIIPPFVLGSSILAFLPGQKKSYAHCFANHSIPTYIRIMKNIHETPAVQVMSMEDDAMDTKYFCELVSKKHRQPVTLNGYCQGGFSSLCNILSGELDGLVDALITCVAPMDGTRSRGLGQFLSNLPPHFNDLVYGTKSLANGNRIADGDLMGWIYKLKSIEDSGPMVSFFRDIMMGSGQVGDGRQINKTLAALNYWLQYERTDLPLKITEMSFRSYTFPITADGTLPVTIHGRKLNLHAIKEKKIKWLLCYGQSDDLVEKEVALAPLDYIDIEVSPFPKGHVAIATSWSNPESNCPIDSVFGQPSRRGPVRFQLDLIAEKQAKGK